MKVYNMSDTAITKGVFLVKKLWIDNFENSIHAAMGYTECGYLETQQEAEQAVSDAGFYIGTGWPVTRGVQIPNLVIEKLNYFKGK